MEIDNREILKKNQLRISLCVFSYRSKLERQPPSIVGTVLFTAVTVVVASVIVEWREP